MDCRVVTLAAMTNMPDPLQVRSQNKGCGERHAARMSAFDPLRTFAPNYKVLR
jgi:hypothetical protein